MSVKDLVENTNLSTEHRHNRDAKSSCSDCKIRKRKGRKVYDGKLSPQIMRKILEKVADDTLSGARAGYGTITSVLGDEYISYQSGNNRKKLGSGWSYDQHWAQAAKGNSRDSDLSGYSLGKTCIFSVLLWFLFQLQT